MSYRMITLRNGYKVSRLTVFQRDGSHVCLEGEESDFQISAGSRDRVYIYDMGEGINNNREIAVISINRSLEYCGLEEFYKDDQGGWQAIPGRQIFAQYDWEVELYIGPSTFDLTDGTICQRLIYCATDAFC